MRKIAVLICVLISFISVRVHSSVKVDSLKKELTKAIDDTTRVRILSELALSSSKDSLIALNYCKEALNISKKIQYSKGKALAILNMAKIYMENSEYKFSIFYFNQAIELIQEMNNNDLLVHAYNHVGAAYYYLGEYKDAQVFFEKTYELSAELDYTLFMSKSLSNLAAIHIISGDYYEALRVCNRSIEINRTANNKEALMLAYINMGASYFSLGDRTKATQYYQTGLSLAEELDDKKNMAIALTNLASVQTLLGNYENSIEFNKKAISIIDNENQLPVLLTNIGRDYMDLEQDSLAIVYCNRALEISQKIESSDTEAGALYILGMIYIRMKNNAQALKCLSRALKIYTRISNNEGIAKAYYKIAGIHLMNNKLDLAKYYAGLSLDIDEKINRAEGLMLSHEQLFFIYSQKKDFEKALKHYKLFNELQDSIYSNENIKQLTTLEMQYEFDKEKKLTQVEQERIDAIRNEELKRQKVLMNAFIVGFALVFLIAIIIVRGYNQKRKSNLKLIKQKRAIESQAKELSKANTKLKELDGFKESLTSMIVHDLKTPLNSMLNISMSLPYQDQVIKMQKSSKQMLNMVLNILDVYKHENADMKVDKTEELLFDIFFNAKSDIDFLTQQKSITITDSLNKQQYIIGDTAILKRVFVNILSNSIKYSPINGQIMVSLSKADAEGYIKVEISDSGQGIPEDKVSTIFEKFTQIDPRSSGNIHSTGLGLAFCKMAIEAHGGQIGVESELGIGTSIWFTLPVAKDQNLNIHANTLYPQKGVVILSDSDKAILKPFYSSLSQMQVYEVTYINDVLIKIIADSDTSIYKWKLELKNAVATLNTERYNELVNMLIN